MKKTCVVLLGILLLGTGLVLGCAGEEGPAQAKDGDTVKVQVLSRIK